VCDLLAAEQTEFVALSDEAYHRQTQTQTKLADVQHAEMQT